MSLHAVSTVPAPDLVKPVRALISVSDKTQLIETAKALRAVGVEILSTGGSAKALEAEGIMLTEVGTFTGFPEMMDGRVKTLHPKIHGGILQVRTNSQHQFQATEHSIPPIDIVIVNLYPFAATIDKGADFATSIENIDIGGPALIRAAAKNHDFVTVLTSPSQYAGLLDELKKNNGAIGLDFRKRCAFEAFTHTAAYDSMVSSWFAGQLGDDYPEVITASYTRKQMLRYGENPHQKGAVYVARKTEPCVARAEQVQGKELSYNNYNDADAAFELASEFSKPTVAIIKHANPCGVASAKDYVSAYKQALACDPVSAFGGVIAINGKLDAATATAISDIFTEVIIAPEADEDAKKIIAAKKNLRLLLTHGMADAKRAGATLRSIAGGLLLQSRDDGHVTAETLKVVTKRKPSDDEVRDMLFAFRVGKHVKSNAIVYAKNEATVGVGAGQMSRVDSSRIAAWKAGEAAKAAGLAEPLTKGCVVASDAFFPFADGLLAAAEAGATAIIQPGGSVRDDEVIAAADNAGLAMVFTGIRHFRH
ncbi:MAG: bifunctional phosphoribosylaminoimidazolecarboxamide formyltransferase/IMP cyclohydrolase [Alphaproteobacteria bacterium]|nr:bifunctional phosphoribosylaminoimidazolecarboxamide formyltransferase/IMP cyclohydrolase [Alphaproteobacteria bacterium]